MNENSSLLIAINSADEKGRGGSVLGSEVDGPWCWRDTSLLDSPLRVRDTQVLRSPLGKTRNPQGSSRSPRDGLISHLCGVTWYKGKKRDTTQLLYTSVHCFLFIGVFSVKQRGEGMG